MKKKEREMDPIYTRSRRKSADFILKLKVEFEEAGKCWKVVEFSPTFSESQVSRVAQDEFRYDGANQRRVSGLKGIIDPSPRMTADWPAPSDKLSWTTLSWQ